MNSTAGFFVVFVICKHVELTRSTHSSRGEWPVTSHVSLTGVGLVTDGGGGGWKCH